MQWKTRESSTLKGNNGKAASFVFLSHLWGVGAERRWPVVEETKAVAGCCCGCCCCCCCGWKFSFDEKTALTAKLSTSKLTATKLSPSAEDNGGGGGGGGGATAAKEAGEAAVAAEESHDNDEAVLAGRAAFK